MREIKYHAYLDSEERTILLHSLVELKNQLIQQGRYTDCVDELIVKVINAPVKKLIGEAKSVDDGYLVCTVNSFISDKLKPYDFAKGDDYHSYTRYSVVMDNCINNVKNNDPVVETQKLLKGEYGFMCQYDDEPDFETIWSSIFDLSNLMIYRAEGDPRRKKFITDKRLHNIVIGRKDAEK